MALSVIIVLYVCVGVLAAAGSIFISQKLFSAKAEQIFFALFLIAIAAFYLVFTAYFGQQRAWRMETGAVIVFAVFGVLGARLPLYSSLVTPSTAFGTSFMRFTPMAESAHSAVTKLVSSR
jgi:predicted ABC-type sugar transport system permease subunit